ncbi:MAG: hypothetical protein HY540_05695 [Deltaproteobacteria bacterium]|nr:hypothetical protein [Deltaproteobacteria bacterium]
MIPFLIGVAAFAACAACADLDVGEIIKDFELSPDQTKINRGKKTEKEDEPQPSVLVLGKHKNRELIQKKEWRGSFGVNALLSSDGYLYPSRDRIHLCERPWHHPETDELVTLNDAEGNVLPYNGTLIPNSLDYDIQVECLHTDGTSKNYSMRRDLATVPDTNPLVVWTDQPDTNNVFCNLDRPLEKPIFEGGATCFAQLFRSKQGTLGEPLPLLTVREIGGTEKVIRPLTYQADQSNYPHPGKPVGDEIVQNLRWCFQAWQEDVLRSREFFDPESLHTAAVRFLRQDDDGELRVILPHFLIYNQSRCSSPDGEGVFQPICPFGPEDDVVFQQVPFTPSHLASDPSKPIMICMDETIHPDPGTEKDVDPKFSTPPQFPPPEEGGPSPLYFVEMTVCESGEIDKSGARTCLK